MEPGYDLLPKRRKNEQESLSCGNKQDYLTNYYEIRLGQKDYVVYQYSLKTDPELPADSSQLLK